MDVQVGNNQTCLGIVQVTEDGIKEIASTKTSVLEYDNGNLFFFKFKVALLVWILLK